METTASLHITKPRNVTYLGVPATVYTIARSKNAAERKGERISVVQWHDTAIGQSTEWPAGTTTVHHIEGDGRSHDFISHSPMHATDDPVAYASEVL